MMHRYITFVSIIFDSSMGSLKLYDINIPCESIAAEREAVYLNKSVEKKIYSLLNLIRISVQLNGGRPLTKPEGKGIIITRS